VFPRGFKCSDIKALGREEHKQSSLLQREFLLPLKVRNRYPGTYQLFTPILKKMGVLELVVIG